MKADLLIDQHDIDFSFLHEEDNTDQILELRKLASLLPTFSQDKDLVSSKYSIYQILKTKHSALISIKVFKNLVFRFKKKISSTLNLFDDDIFSISRLRHAFINKELSFFGNLEYSTYDTALKNIEHTEPFYRSKNKNNYIITNNKNSLLQYFTFHSKTHLYLHKLTDLFNLIINPLILKISLKNLIYFSNNSTYSLKFTCSLITSMILKYFSKINIDIYKTYNNLIPNHNFKFSIFKKISGSFSDGVFTMSSTP
jgi:predicted transcriptional regulator